MRQLAKLRDFCDRSDVQLSGALNNVAAHLCKATLNGSVILNVKDGCNMLAFGFDLGRPAVDILDFAQASTRSADFIVYADKATLLDILRGVKSPLSALAEGQLRYGGNERFGLTLFRALAVNQDSTFEPCREPAMVANGNN